MGFQNRWEAERPEDDLELHVLELAAVSNHRMYERFAEHVIALLGRLVLEDPPRPSAFRFDIGSLPSRSTRLSLSTIASRNEVTPALGVYLVNPALAAAQAVSTM